MVPGRPLQLERPRAGDRDPLRPGVGGSLLELYTDGSSYEMGRILAWEPGSRVLFRYSNVYLPPEPPTEVEVRFERIPNGTRVTLEHRGLDRMPPAIAAGWEQRAWIVFMQWYAQHVPAG